MLMGLVGLECIFFTAPTIFTRSLKNGKSPGQMSRPCWVTPSGILLASTGTLGGDGGPSQSAAETHHSPPLSSLAALVPDQTGQLTSLQRSHYSVHASMLQWPLLPCTAVYRTRRAVQLKSHRSCRLPRIFTYTKPQYT